MNVRDLSDRLATIVPDARIPVAGPMDDLHAFRFASVAFVPPFMDAVVRISVGADDDGSAHARLVDLASLLEEVLAGEDDDVADALAMRLVHTRLCAQPILLAATWPYLGPQTQRVAGKFLRLAQECERREAAALGEARSLVSGSPPAAHSGVAPSPSHH